MTTHSLNRFLSASHVEEILSLSRVTVWRMVKAREFPPPIRISRGRVAWLESDVRAWIAAKSEQKTR
ncbi:MAG: AlpA family phage regulatory protein [Verrucomicrobiaceae bacterium]|nr:MAG: AlpA family phage regulatory protein [Verrucomicrobiaceae bacterium]